jgi:hypothetical protein
MYLSDCSFSRAVQGDKIVFSLSKGAILGVGVLASKMMVPGAWIWKDEIVDGEPSVGAVSPVTVTATGRTKVYIHDVLYVLGLDLPVIISYSLSLCHSSVR